MEIQLEALVLLAQMYRWQYPADYLRTGALYGVLKPVFAELCIDDHSNQLRIVARLIGRPDIKSFKDVLGGEIKSLRDEPCLKAIIEYVAKEMRII